MGDIGWKVVHRLIESIIKFKVQQRMGQIISTLIEKIAQMKKHQAARKVVNAAVK